MRDWNAFRLLWSPLCRGSERCLATSSSRKSIPQPGNIAIADYRKARRQRLNLRSTGEHCGGDAVATWTDNSMAVCERRFLGSPASGQTRSPLAAVGIGSSSTVIIDQLSPSACGTPAIRDFDSCDSTDINNPAGWTGFCGDQPRIRHRGGRRMFDDPSALRERLALAWFDQHRGYDASFGVHFVGPRFDRHQRNYIRRSRPKRRTRSLTRPLRQLAVADMTFSVTPVPEPSAMTLLLALSMVGLVVLAWRRRD